MFYIRGLLKCKQKNFMKKNRLMYALLLPMMFLSVSYVAAQDPTVNSSEDEARVDSLVRAYDQQEKVEKEKRENADELSDLKAEKKETEAKAEEARRVEAEANDAAKASRMAYRKEKKAQRTREQADKQADKAEKARSISDQN